MTKAVQQDFFGVTPNQRSRHCKKPTPERSGTFSDNTTLPVHRWFRYSAGFSANWVKETIKEREALTVLDPFLGSGTVCIAADELGVDSYGVESHSFVYRLARGKLSWAANIYDFQRTVTTIKDRATHLDITLPDRLPALLKKCYSEEVLSDLFKIREAFFYEAPHLSEDIRSLVFLLISAILRPSSHVGTAQWQYVLPNKRKAKNATPFISLAAQATIMENDLRLMQHAAIRTRAVLIQGDARTLAGVPEDTIDLVVTSPPYANNYDYADATRLEMTFWGEVTSWSDLHESVRKYLIRSSSQHVSKDRLSLDRLLSNPVVEPIREELSSVCRKLSEIRGTRSGNKAYHTMVAAYFSDMGETLRALRRVTKENGAVCLVIGDSAPYGIHVPVEKWLGTLALAAGFRSWEFTKMRARNVKWKNRKHNVPLHEGRLWIQG